MVLPLNPRGGVFLMRQAPLWILQIISTPNKGEHWTWFYKTALKFKHHDSRGRHSSGWTLRVLLEEMAN